MMEEVAVIAATPAGESETAKKLQELENRLDQAVIQCNEVTHIRKVYEAIIEKLQEVNPAHFLIKKVLLHKFI